MSSASAQPSVRCLKYVLLSTLAFASFCGLGIGAYVIKCQMGIDLMAGPSFMHRIVY